MIAILKELKRKVKGKGLNLNGSTGILSDLEFNNIYKLFTLVAANDQFPIDLLKNKINILTNSKPGYLDEFKFCINTLDNFANDNFSNDFATLTNDEANKILSKILRKYPSRFNNSTWRLKSRITSDNIDLVLSTEDGKRIRNFVIRELLIIFYRSKWGWNVVDYFEYPSHILLDEDSVEVEKIDFQDNRYYLFLSDTTVEELDFKSLVIKNGTVVSVKVKEGKQFANFTSQASNQINEIVLNFFDESDFDENINDEALTQKLIKKTSSQKPLQLKEHYEVIIVGSGPSGASTAEKLVNAGMNVLMIESGSEHDRKNHQRMNDFIQNNHYYEFPKWSYSYNGEDLDLNTWMVRYEGGSSNAWGGTTPRFLKSDLNLKSNLGIAEDWPITFEELEKYYGQAESFLGVSGFEDNPWETGRTKPYPMPGFAMSDSDLMIKEAGERIGIKFHSVPSARNSSTNGTRSACVNYSVCRACPVEAKYCAASTIRRLKHKDNFTIIYNHHVRKLIKNESGKIISILMTDQNKVDKLINGDLFVLATHAIGNSHILLNSKTKEDPNGLANSSNTVGKYLMDHLKFFYTGRIDSKVQAHKMGFETATSLHFHDHPERNNFSACRIVVRENSGPTPEDIAVSSGYWGHELKQEIQRTFGHYLTLGALLEQLPYEENCVTLDENKKNEFGDPSIKTNWFLSKDYEKKSVRFMSEKLKGILTEAGAKKIFCNMGLAHSGHYSGGHRFGHDPKTSVCNEFGQTHDIENLFLAGTGLLPTCSTNNPTLTAVALSLRMSDYIIAKFR